MGLHIIKQYVAESAALMAEALGADVEIVDSNAKRVAGTGYYETGSRTISDGVIYKEVFRTGKQVLIHNPRRHELCEKCQHRDRCLEKMEIACPITLNGEIIGAAGLICSTNEQKMRLMENIRTHMFFITKTCGFMAEKAGDCMTISSQGERIAHLEQIISKGAMYNENDEKGEQIRQISDLERIEIAKALNKFGCDTEGKRLAAKSLGIGIATLYRKLERK